MLQMSAFQSFNWGYTPFLDPLPIGQMTLLYGRNGSGKTTYLTALGLLLGVQRLQTGQTFDRYIREGANWAFLRAIVDNHPAADGKRPFDRIVPNPDGLCYSTLACMLVSRSGSWQRTYFIVPGRDFQPEPEKKVDKAYVFTAEKYRQALEQVGVRQALLSLLEMGTAGLRGMREPIELFKFFVRLVGSETIRTKYNSARREWREAQAQADRLQARYDHDAHAVEETGKTIQIQRQRRLIEQKLLQYRLLIDHARLRDAKKAREQRQAELQRQALDKQQAERELTALAKKLAGLQEEEATFQQRLAAWKTRRDQALDRYTAKVAEQAGEQKLAEQLAAEIKVLHELTVAPLAEIETLLERAQEEEAEQRQRERQVKQRVASLREAKRALEGGHVTFPEEVNAYLTLLRAQHIPFKLIADYVGITDARWLRAVEGVLGGERFTVIVEDAVQRLQAKRLAEQQQYPYWVSPPKALPVRSPHPKSLWHVVDVLDEAIKGWVADRLLQVLRVETVEEGDTLSTRDGLLTITPQAYWQEKRGGRSVWPRTLVCGSAAREAQLQEVTAELEQLKGPLASEAAQLHVIQEQIRRLRQQQALAERKRGLAAKERELEHRQAVIVALTRERDAYQATFQALKDEEQDWTHQSNHLALQRQELVQEQQHLQGRFQDILEHIRMLDAESLNLKRSIERMEQTLPALPDDWRAAFDAENWSESEYQQRITDAELQLEQLPKPALEYDEVLYEREKQRLQQLHQEVTTARQNVSEHRALFEHALRDYRLHIDQLFTRGMAFEFQRLCQLVNARGDISVQQSPEDLDDWGLDVRIGFDGKPREALPNASLSRGQEVLTGLYLVLAALRTVHATPVLLLDELMSLLDEENAPRVMAGLRETGVQCFVATPQSRPEADEHSDVLWGFSCKERDQQDAPPIVVIVRREGQQIAMQ